MKSAKQFLINVIINSKDVKQTRTLIKEFERKLKDITVGKDEAFITVIKIVEIDRPFNEQ